MLILNAVVMEGVDTCFKGLDNSRYYWQKVSKQVSRMEVVVFLIFLVCTENSPSRSLNTGSTLFHFCCYYCWCSCCYLESLYQELVNFFCKGPESKYFSFFWTTGLTAWLLYCSEKAAIHHRYTNGWAYVPINLYLQKPDSGPGLAHEPLVHSLLWFPRAPLPVYSWNTLCHPPVSAASILLFSFFHAELLRIQWCF